MARFWLNSQQVVRFTPTLPLSTGGEWRKRLVLPFLSLFLALVFTFPALAQAPKIDPRTDPNRPTDYSYIVGRYDIKVSAEPTDVEVERHIVVRVEIFGEGPKTDEPRGKDLRLFPEAWDKGESPDFYPPVLLEESVDRPKKTWTFLYRLTPKHVGVESIHGIRLVYYDPSVPDDNKFLREPVDQIKITVKPRPDAPPPITIDIDAVPNSFRSTLPVMLTRPAAPFELTWVYWLIALIMPPISCVIAADVYCRMAPDAMRDAALYRMEAAERAIAKLRAGECVWHVVCAYLHERFGFSVVDPAPSEIHAFLKRAGFSLEACAEARSLFHTCDAIRFTHGKSPESIKLADDAVRLIQTLEADACAQR
ncbi:MAG: protein BatD [Planctomycetes bacterium]|nr:protein BatD [Planctomycetota bacterium]